jgi:hypothetical protein
MTAIVNEITTRIISSGTFDALSTTYGLIVALLLIFLLVQKELLRAHGGRRARLWLQTLNIAIVPLVVAFGLVVVMRIVDLVREAT